MDLSKLDWKAIGIGIVIAFVVNLIPLIGFIGPIAGGAVAVYFAKVKESKLGVTYGAIVGFIGGLVTGIIGSIVLKNAMQMIPTIAGISASTILAMAIVISIVLNTLFGLIGGVLGVKFVKKKQG
ncbi:MAG: DUF5518 domain-containing protein [Candidatus Nanoarchaeia archaeon]